ncbi:hypothetical protein M426DRAFT_80633 [Hypoxylon sp. CI-4A]|nr:hypothetical protein M426DRAFT_80633 [Hypoxylon sp. CI-4A]
MDNSDDLLEGEPPIIDPYEVLDVERTADESQIKSAYRKLALKNHPDKVPEDQKQKAHELFQSIAFAYAVLSDPARRKRYDETGSTSESIVDSDGFSWSDFYREQYRDTVTSDAIKKFAKQYKGSDEEKDDILIAYEQNEGDMDKIYETVMLSDVLGDDERFRAIIDEAIASKDVPAFKAYTNETKKSKAARIKAAKSESNEAEEYAKELGVHDKLFGKDKKGSKGKGKKGTSEDDLAALIRRNQEGRNNFLDNLAAKYGAKTSTKKGKKHASPEEEEPSEEAFQAAAAKLKKKKKDLSPEEPSEEAGTRRSRRGGRRAVPEEEPSEEAFQAAATKLKKGKKHASLEEELEEEIPQTTTTRSKRGKKRASPEEPDDESVTTRSKRGRKK